MILRVELGRLSRAMAHKSLIMKYLRYIVDSAFAAGLVCILFGGCSSTPPYAASTNLRLTPDEKAEKLVLSPSDEAQALAAMRAVADDQSPVNPPRAAEAGVRWRDVPIALYYAATEVEMATTRVREMPDVYEVELKTVDDHPGRMVVRRVGGDRVYEADAVVGRFGDDVERVRQLLAAFDRQMKLFGRKRELSFTIDRSD